MPHADRSARVPFRRARPALEPLEDRQLLSATVTAVTGSVRGSLFADWNGDGVRGVAEPGLPGRTVYLDRNTNGRLDAGEATAVSGGDGGFLFTNVAPGRYVLQQVALPGWQPTRVVVSPAPAVQSSDADRLMGLARFRSDARFAGIDGRGFTIAVLDTGIDDDHSYFGRDADRNGVADAIVYQHDFVSGGKVADDEDGHGTHIASLIASRDRAHPGVAPGVNLIVLKVLDESGSGNFSTIQSALRWVVNNAAAYHIAAVNLSLSDGGFYRQSTALYGINDELAALAAANVPVIAAAGNDYSPTATGTGISYPGADPSVISVGAVWDANRGGGWEWDGGARDDATGPDRIVSFSQRTPGIGELFAPGTLLTGAAPGGGTSELSGTSAATGVVSGVVALAQQLAVERLGRTLTTGELRTLLQNSGRLIRDGDDERDNVANTNAAYRRVDVYALAEAILNLGSVSPGPSAGSQTVIVAAGVTVDGAELGNRYVGANHAPTLTGPGRLTRTAAGQPAVTGDRVSDILAGTVRDVDVSPTPGMVVVGTGGLGRWQYSRDDGRTWLDLGTISAGQGRLLAASDRVRFLPVTDWRGVARLDYRAWDQTSGQAGALVSLTSGPYRPGGSSPVSVEVQSAIVRVGGFWASAASPGTVGSVLAGTNRPLAAGQGIAIVGLSGVGTWQYSLDGRTWFAVGAVGPHTARLLPATARLRFLPATPQSAPGKLSYRVWKGAGVAGAVVDPLRADQAGNFVPGGWTIAWPL
ncbi:MAG: S8 family serine peptidase [Gemmataceae bacterium]